MDMETPMAVETSTTQHATTGQYMRSPEQMAKDQKAAELRSIGLTYQMIADRFGVTKSAAYKMVQRAVEEIPTEGAEMVRKIELEKLDQVERYLNVILQQPPLKVGNNGKVVMNRQEVINETTGEKTWKEVPLIDESARINAAQGLLKTQAARAKLLGLNAPTRIQEEIVVYEADPDREQRILEALERALDAKRTAD